MEDMTFAEGTGAAIAATMNAQTTVMAELLRLLQEKGVLGQAYLPVLMSRLRQLAELNRQPDELSNRSLHAQFVDQIADGLERRLT